MKRLWFLLDALNTRTKLVALLLLVIVPYSSLLIYSTYDRYQLLQREVQAQTLHQAETVAESQKRVIAYTLELLDALANDKSIQTKDWAACRSMLPAFWGYFKETYANFHVAEPDGSIVCSAKPIASTIKVNDRKDFQDVLASKQAVVGDLVLSRTSGLFSLIIRIPVLDTHGQVASIISAQISAEQFNEAVSSIPLSVNGELIISDRGGKIIVHEPAPADWAGRTLPDTALGQAMLASSDTIVEARGLDNIPRIYGVSTTGHGPDNGLRVAIGAPQSEIESEVDRSLLKNVVTMILVITMVLISAWFGVDTLVLRKIRILIDTIQKLKEGQTSARTGLRYGVDELSHIARAIDEAAAGLERLLKLLRDQAIHDPLTELYNRRFLDECLKHELSKAARNGRNVGVIMVDIDHFKKINDTHGHKTGDEVLIAVAKALLGNVRAGDIVCRFGGEEFAIVLPGANLSITMARAEALRSIVEKLAFHHLESPVGTITISLGAAVFPDHGATEAALLKSADIALYAAKGAGRNQVMAADVIT